MMTTRRKPWLLFVALLTAFGLIAAACGGSDGSDDTASDTADAVDTSDSDDAADDATDDDEAMDDDAMDDEAMDDGEGHSDLAGLAECPNPLVFQTDWFPEPEHGALYNLTAGEGSIDAESGRFSGPPSAGSQ